jgi:cyclic dehypoxanthinyl futalosine synthase
MLDRIIDKVLDGKRIAPAEALTLWTGADLLTLGGLADGVRRRLHPDGVVTYIIDRNINYTNACNAFCTFCAFYRAPRHDEAYVLSHEVIDAKIEEVLAVGGEQILLQGGHNPELKIDYYEELFRHIKGRFPSLWLHALSPPEIIHIKTVSRLSVRETLERLVAAGLDSIPGGGAEILVDEVRERLATNKCSAGEWLEVMETAHGMGLKTTATMMFGHIETPAQRIEHLRLLRDLQDRTGGFTAFILWTYQPGNTDLGGVEATSAHYLRMLAVSRIFLDNFANLQASWVTQGPKVGSATLRFGVNDMGSTMFEENVVSSAGTTFAMDARQIERHARASGFKVARRNMRYQLLSEPS